VVDAVGHASGPRSQSQPLRLHSPFGRGDDHSRSVLPAVVQGSEPRARLLGCATYPGARGAVLHPDERKTDRCGVQRVAGSGMGTEHDLARVLFRLSVVRQVSDNLFDPNIRYEDNRALGRLPL